MTDAGDDHLAAAERFAALALHLDPRRPEGEHLLAEARTARGDRALSRGDLAATVRDWDEAFAYADPVEATPELIDAMIQRVVELRAEGSYRQCLALARRAATLAKRAFGELSAPTLTAGFFQADALQLVGFPAEPLPPSTRCCRPASAPAAPSTRTR